MPGQASTSTRVLCPEAFAFLTSLLVGDCPPRELIRRGCSRASSFACVTSAKASYARVCGRSGFTGFEMADYKLCLVVYRAVLLLAVLTGWRKAIRLPLSTLWLLILRYPRRKSEVEHPSSMGSLDGPRPISSSASFSYGLCSLTHGSFRSVSLGIPAGEFSVRCWLSAIISVFFPRR